MKKILFPILILSIILSMSNCKEDIEDESTYTENKNTNKDPPKKYKISYNANGASGDVPVDLNAYTVDDKIYLLPPDIDAATSGMAPETKEEAIKAFKEAGYTMGTLKRKGYHFSSWDISEANYNNLTKAKINDVIKINKDITIYAIWEENLTY